MGATEPVVEKAQDMTAGNSMTNPTPTTPTKSAQEDHSVRHIDDEGYECGGPHYRPPSGGDWAWCEPDGTWLSTTDDDHQETNMGKIWIDADTGTWGDIDNLWVVDAPEDIVAILNPMSISEVAEYARECGVPMTEAVNLYHLAAASPSEQAVESFVGVDGTVYGSAEERRQAEQQQLGDYERMKAREPREQT